MRTNEEMIIEMLKPALDEFQNKIFKSCSTDVRIQLSGDSEVGYKLEISSWCNCERHVAPTLAKDSRHRRRHSTQKKAVRERKQAEILRLQQELEGMQKDQP